MQRLPAITHTRFGLFRFRSPLLTESQLFSLPVGTEMFHFPTFPPTPLYIQGEVAGHDSGTFEVSPFGHPRITARLPTPHGLSQVATSFIGSRCQGIHRPPSVACHQQTKNIETRIYKDARVHYTILTQQTNTPTKPTSPSRDPVQTTTPPPPTKETGPGESPRTQQRAHPPHTHTPTTFHTHPQPGAGSTHHKCAPCAKDSINASTTKNPLPPPPRTGRQAGPSARPSQTRSDTMGSLERR